MHITTPGFHMVSGDLTAVLLLTKRVLYHLPSWGWLASFIPNLRSQLSQPSPQSWVPEVLVTHVYHWSGQARTGGPEEHPLPFRLEAVIPEWVLAPVCVQTHMCVQTACVLGMGVKVCVRGL